MIFSLLSKLFTFGNFHFTNILYNFFGQIARDIKLIFNFFTNFRGRKRKRSYVYQPDLSVSGQFIGTFGKLSEIPVFS